MPWNIVCDFDGTIAPVDVTDMVLERFADPHWRELEAAWQAGEISGRDCMACQIALLRCPLQALNDLLDDIDIDPAFPEFVADCRERGQPLAIVSDGLDYAIRRILRRHKVAGIAVFANRMLRAGTDRYALEFLFGATACGSGVCKCRFRSAGGATLLIGDGRSDFCLSRAADLTIAKGVLLETCRREGLAAIPFDSFADVRAVANRLMVQTRRIDLGMSERSATP